MDLKVRLFHEEKEFPHVISEFDSWEAMVKELYHFPMSAFESMWAEVTAPVGSARFDGGWLRAAVVSDMVQRVNNK